MKSIHYYVGFAIGYFKGRRASKWLTKAIVKYNGFENIPVQAIRDKMGPRAENLLFLQNVKIMAASICIIYEELMKIRPIAFMGIVSDYLDNKPVPTSFITMINDSPNVLTILNYIAYVDKLYVKDDVVRSFLGYPTSP